MNLYHCSFITATIESEITSFSESQIAIVHAVVLQNCVPVYLKHHPTFISTSLCAKTLPTWCKRAVTLRINTAVRLPRYRGIHTRTDARI
jgi:hypothetical protein